MESQSNACHFFNSGCRDVDRDSCGGRHCRSPLSPHLHRSHLQTGMWKEEGKRAKITRLKKKKKKFGF
jgi:hypothetical protein